APPWVLPYELVEAGLLRVLVLDERIAQRADKFYTAMEQARPQFRKALMMKDDTPPKVRDVARRAGIEVARRLAVCIVDENKNVVRGKRLDVATREWDALELNGGNCEFKDGTAIRIYLREQTGEQTAPKIDKVKTTEQIHLIVIHQGIIDLIKNEYKVGEKELLTALSTQFWTVVESGRGIPPEIQQNGEKFLSYSLLDRVFHGGRVAKLGLIRKLMEVTRNPKS
ncbi:MAG: hypothetical protein OEV64_04105, partial [Desulfobulbaceae bacterium]|nr:hypothetical protein [Desulfobulbaceae bacterium]